MREIISKARGPTRNVGGRVVPLASLDPRISYFILYI